MKIALIVNYKNKANIDLAHSIKEYILVNNGQIVIPDNKPGFSVEECNTIDFSGVNVAIVLGGDGTILTAGRNLALYDVALLGVNMGTVGFLSELEKEEVFEGINLLLANEFTLKQRMMLNCRVFRNGCQVVEMPALNDLVFKQGLYCRTIMYDLYLDEQFVATYHADGMITSTPTGSTAYSLSAGGPIVMPDMDLMIITPVSPHSLFAKSMIIPASSLVKVVFRSKSGTTILAGDGQIHIMPEEGDNILITAHPKKVSFVTFGKKSFMQRVQKKLNRS